MRRRGARDWMRHLAPRSGRRYELFDSSLFLLWIGLVGYVIFPAPPSVAAGLPGPLAIVSESDLGLLVVATSLAGAVCAYLPGRWLEVGYMLPRIGALFMAANFAVGIVVLAGQAVGWWLAEPGIDVDQSLRASLLYLMIFGWPVRRLKRDNEVEHVGTVADYRGEGLRGR